MDFTLHQLQVFLKITQTESITKAAESLHLTQPAVSAQLKNFQDQFDVPLTEIIGRKLFITDFGKEIAEAAQKVIEQVKAIDYKTSAFKGKLSGRLKLSIVSTGKYVIPYFLSSFLKKNTEIELVLDVTNKTKVVESLEKNETDFALVSIIPKHLKVEKEPLMENKLFLIGYNDFREVKKKEAPQTLEKLPLIFREKGSGTRLMMEEFIDKNNLTVFKKVELTSNEAVKQALIAGLGFSIMPLIGLKNELNADTLKIIPIKGLPISTTWNLIWLSSKKLSPVAQAFLNDIQTQKQQIIETHFAWYDKY